MRLTSLTLTNYGPFRAQRIGFDAARGRINLLIAPNGAGKSVLRNAFGDLLFGIHAQTEMGFRYGYTGMRLLAEAVGPDGAPFVFGRRKGRGDTLIGADGAALDAALMARLLGGTDKALLERLFALDTERLRVGGAELLQSGGSVADALLSAAGGLRQARQLRTALDGQRDALAPERRAQARPFYQALDRFGDARRRLEASLLRPEAREKQQTELAHARGDLALHEKAARAASARIAHLNRVRLVAGPLRTHDAAASWLAENPSAPTLPAETGARLAAAAEAVQRAGLLVERARQEQVAAAERAAGVVCDAVLLDSGAAIDALVTRAGVAAQSGRDIPKREGELEHEERRIAALLHQLGADLPVARAAEAIPREAVVAEARRLFTEYAKLHADLDRLPPERDAAAREIVDTETKLAILPPPTDTATLLREVKEVRRAGDPVPRAREAAQALAEQQATLRAAEARIPAWGERAAALPVQPLARYERIDAARVVAERALADADTTLARLRGEAAVEAARLAALAEAGVLPDVAAIAAARAHRDGGWRLIYRRAFTADAPDAAAEAAWAGAAPVPLAYERAVTAADTLADLRTTEAERLAKTAEIARRLAATEAGVAQAETRVAEATAAHAAALGAWRAALAPLGLEAATGLAELRTLLAGRDKILEAARDMATAVAARAALASQQAAWAARLADALAVAPDSLSALLALAEQRIEEAAKADKERDRLRERLDAHRRGEAEKAAALARAETHMATLLGAWQELRAALHRPDDEAPATTVALLDQFAALQQATLKADDLRQRLAEMRDEISAFSIDAAALVALAAPDLVQADAVAGVEALRRRLTEQRGLAKQRAELLKQVDRGNKSLADERKQQQSSSIALQTVLSSIGTDSVAAAEPLVALAAERAGMTETVRQTARDLAGSSDGLALDALREQVARCDIDAIPGEIREAEAARDRAWGEAQALTARIATTQDAMDRQAAETGSVQAEAERQAAIATLGRVLDEALELHLAGLILEDALGRVDAAGTSALLARIGALFRQLTDGAYERIVADDSGDGDARLQVVERAFPDEPKAVGALSDGTRDQLFLALRLAAIEDHVTTAPPLPFVADDILQTFDEARSLAAMRALVKLSAHVQVILLSHHAHVRDLARELGAERVHVCAIEAAG